MVGQAGGPLSRKGGHDEGELAALGPDADASARRTLAVHRDAQLSLLHTFEWLDANVVVPYLNFSAFGTGWLFFLIATNFAYVPQVMLVEGQGILRRWAEARRWREEMSNGFTLWSFFR